MKIERIEMPQDAPTDQPLAVYDATTLTNGHRKAVITLGDQFYTLQITRQGKLLLTK